MQPSSVLTESGPILDMHHAIMHPADAAHATSSGSMTPRSHAQPRPTDFQETASSQSSDSPTFQLSSSDVSQHTHLDGNGLEVSPISSQEHGSAESRVSPPQKTAQDPQYTDLPSSMPATAALTSPKREDFSRDLLSGQKRTASGQMKRSSITSIDDLKKEQANTRHSRTSSILSNGSNGSVMEVC